MAAKEHRDVKQSVEYSVYVRAAIFMSRAVAPLVLRYRIVLNDQHRGLTPDQVIEKILAAVPMPRPQQAWTGKQAGR